MAVAWTRHRFSGGTLALDTANTVVLRGDPLRSFDRFDDPAEIARFAEAASRFRGDELAGRAFPWPIPLLPVHRSSPFGKRPTGCFVRRRAPGSWTRR